MSSAPDSHDSDILAAALADYLTRIDSGEAVCREEFLAQHPTCASGLRKHFNDVDFIGKLAVSGASAELLQETGLPQILGDYELLSEIGRGGMGVVYRARERSTGRHVALKMLLHGWYLAPAAVLRFRNEATSAAAVRHPGIVPIYHVGVDEGRWFYTMPIIEGINLAERILQGPLDPQEAARFLLEVAEAVAAAHRAGVVHRDLKPANVLLDDRGTPYVGDFGLARRFAEEVPSLTMTGDLLGTPNYMAPEQVNGQNALVGPLADVYALGAILYAMLVGQPPFHSESISDTLYKICNDDPPRLRQLRRGIPRDLETICLKCLEKSPDSRYSSAAALADDLRRFLAGEPLSARPISRVGRARRWVIRNPMLGSLATAIILTLIAGTGFSLHYARQAILREQQAKVNLYAADMNLAQQHVRSGAVGSAVRLLERYRPKSGDEVNAGWEWRHLWHRCHGELRQFKGPKGPLYVAAVSPDGATVAAAGSDRVVWLWEIATGRVIRRMKGHMDTVRDLAFAPGGRYLATVGDDRVCIVWNTTTGEQIATLSGHERPLTTVAFSSDGRLLATGGIEVSRVNLWDAESFTLRHSLDLGPVESVAFAPGDSRLALAARDGNVRICTANEAGSWSLTKTIRAQGDVVRDVAWSAEGSRLASAGKDGIVRVWEIDASDRSIDIGPLNGSIYDVQFSPDDRYLAIAARDRPLSVWEFDSNSFVAQHVGHTGLVTSFDYCPEGWRIVSASEDGTVRLWDAVRTNDFDILEGHTSPVKAVAFSPDGKTLASGGSDDSDLILWDVKSGQPRRRISLARRINDMEFNADGTKLAVAVGNDTSNGRLVIYPIDGKDPPREFTVSAVPIISVAWSPAADAVAVQATDGLIQLVEPTTGKVTAKLASVAVREKGIAFLGDGSRLVTAGNDFARVWDVATQSLVHELRGHAGPVVSVAIDPASRFIATGSNDGMIALWNAATGRRLRTLVGQDGTPLALAFSPDGSQLASCSTNRLAKIWGVSSGLELQTLSGHGYWVRDVAFSPDGHTLATASYDHTVRLWHAPNNGTDAFAEREAAAFLRYLAARDGHLSDVVRKVEAATTISAAVRDEAMRQARLYPVYWPAMVAGHRAANRGDWPKAIEAFARVAQLAPEEPRHWSWLALVSAAGNEPDAYHHACQQLLSLCESGATEEAVFQMFQAWVVPPPAGGDFARLEPFAKGLQAEKQSGRVLAWLFELRRNRVPPEFLDASTPIAAHNWAEDWFVQAIAWQRAGQMEKAAAAYQAGLLDARSRSGQGWIAASSLEMLRVQAEAALATEPADGSRPGDRCN